MSLVLKRDEIAKHADREYFAPVRNATRPKQEPVVAPPDTKLAEAIALVTKAVQDGTNAQGKQMAAMLAALNKLHPTVHGFTVSVTSRDKSGHIKQVEFQNKPETP